MLCSEATIVNSDATGGSAISLRCKRWHCEICRPFNRWEVIKKAEQGKPNVFLTLTCNPARYETPDQAAADMKRALVLLRRHLADKKGIEKLPFIVVFERTKAGWPHMHILCRTPYIHWQWLRGEMARLIGAPQVDIRRISKRKGAAHYISKYIGKDPHAFEGCKRWWRSHNYDMHKPDADEEVFIRRSWQKAECTISQYKTALAETGAIIVEERRNFVRWEDVIERQKFRPNVGTALWQKEKDRSWRSFGAW